jgi:hypothetical protein
VKYDCPLIKAEPNLILIYCWVKKQMMFKFIEVNLIVKRYDLNFNVIYGEILSAYT